VHRGKGYSTLLPFPIGQVKKIGQILPENFTLIEEFPRFLFALR